MVRIKPGTRNEPQVVLLDHGLYKELSDEFRREYCELWKAMILQDDIAVKKYCHELGIENYKLFAEFVLMRNYEGYVS